MSEVPNTSKKILVASRGGVSRAACQLITSLPLDPMGLAALSMNLSHPNAGSTHDLTNVCASSGESVEVVNREGDFVGALADMAGSDDVAVTVLFEENNSPQVRSQLAYDAAAVLKRTHKSVLVAVGECSGGVKDNLLVAIAEGGKRTRLTERRVDSLADLTSAEVVVLYIAKQFWPTFSRVAVGMRSSQESAMREIHDEDVEEATAQAMHLCETLQAVGAKSRAVGKSGKLIAETVSTAESSGCGLICIPVDTVEITNEKHIRSLLMELLGCTRIPVLILPTEVRAH